MIGDTRRLPEVLAFTGKGVEKELERQVSLGLAVLGDVANTGRLMEYFSKDWKQNRRHTVSQAVFGTAWLREATTVDQLIQLATKARSRGVRAMAVAALGYTAAAERVCPLSRCYENQNYRSKFAGWDLLQGISLIL